jgi:hypothetical protein
MIVLVCRGMYVAKHATVMPGADATPPKTTMTQVMVVMRMMVMAFRLGPLLKHGNGSSINEGYDTKSTQGIDKGWARDGP